MTAVDDQHDVDAIYVPICSVCGKDVEYDEDAQQWRHLGQEHS